MRHVAPDVAASRGRVRGRDWALVVAETVTFKAQSTGVQCGAF